jgi:hypothetical protein
MIKAHSMHIWKCHDKTPYYVQFNICQLKINTYTPKIAFQENNKQTKRPKARSNYILSTRNSLQILFGNFKDLFILIGDIMLPISKQFFPRTIFNFYNDNKF